MPQKSSINAVEPTPLRRSKRLLEAVAAKIQKLRSKELEVHTSPISSISPQTHSKSLISSVRNNPRKKINQDNYKKSSNGLQKSPTLRLTASTPEVPQDNIHGKTSNGSTLSTKKINGVEGFEGRRRSPRFNTPEIVDKKNGVRKSNPPTKGRRNVNGVVGFHGSVGSTLVPILENTPEMFVKKCSKKSIGSRNTTAKSKEIVGYEGHRQSPVDHGRVGSPLFAISENTPEVFDKKCTKKNIGSRNSTAKSNAIVGYEGRGQFPKFAIEERTPEVFHDGQLICTDSVDYMDKEATLKGTRNKKSVKRGRQSFEEMGPGEITEEVDFMTPDNGKKKKRNVKCGTNGSCNDGDSQRYKSYFSHQEGLELSLTNLRTPLTSIGENSPQRRQTVGCDKNSTKLVEAKSGPYRCVKSTGGPRKKAENRLIRNQGGVQGWTPDQELALQRAYFAAKPSPQFWKKISKMVPGKSAQDCFDKVQSNNITPSQRSPRYRSRANRTNLSPLCHFSLSGGKLLEPTVLNLKRSRGKQQTKCLAQKTVRHILQKQNKVNQGHQRDLFSILEPNVSSFTQVSPETSTLITPKCLLNSHQKSSSSNKKAHSRVKDLSKPSFSSSSPAVLKHIKDMTSHEKYIDQLHSREARRIAGSRRCANAKDDRKESVQKTDVIKAAKNALVSDARDMIKEFQQLEANSEDSSEDLGDVGDSSGGDDAEC